MFDNVKRVMIRNVSNIYSTESPKEVHAVSYGNT